MGKNDAISIMNDSSLNEKTESFTIFFVIYKNSVEQLIIKETEK